MFRKSLLIIASFLFTLLCIPRYTKAQSNLSISPYSFEKEASKGEIISDTIRLKNESQNEVIVNINVKDFQAKDDTGKQVFLDPSPDNPWGLSHWINIQNQITLAPLEEIEIPFEIKIPIDSEPGGHFGTIFFTINASKDKGIKINMQLGALLFVTVLGEIQENANIDSFTLDENISENSQEKILLSKLISS